MLQSTLEYKRDVIIIKLLKEIKENDIDILIDVRRLQILIYWKQYQNKSTILMKYYISTNRCNKNFIVQKFQKLIILQFYNNI